MNQQKKIYCLTPIYNDWESFAILVDNLQKEQEKQKQYKLVIIAVNDGSNEERTEQKFEIPITILNLKVNIGHQRAIAVGLQYIYNEVSDNEYVVVMDSDGEDKPEDIMLLIEKAESVKDNKIVFAQRKKGKSQYGLKQDIFFTNTFFTF